MASPDMIIDDDLLSLSSGPDVSFVAGCMEDFFEVFQSPVVESSSAPDQSPEPFFLPTNAPQSMPLMSFLSQPPETATGRQPARMVSVESMSKIQARPPKKPSSSPQTPLDSLKVLVSQKKAQQQPAIGSKRPASMCFHSHSNGPAVVASVFEKPSSMLQTILREQEQGCDEPALKKAKIASWEDEKSSSLHDSTFKTNAAALHEACRRPNVTVQEISQLLQQDPDAAQRQCILHRQKRAFDPVTKAFQDVCVPEKYRYPLNLAIQYKCSTPVLEALVDAAPSVLSRRDGNQKQQHTPLHVLFRHQPADYSAAADMMLLKHPPLADIVDFKLNTPLHQAVESGTDLQTVRHLVLLSPNALLKRNFHGRTPLDLAQRHGAMCSDAVADYLWQEAEKQF